ncbi:MAG: methyltransferase domain-containing protein [Myxococcales bacterium]|nr:methyltransferase domain-containing protein [Myxococcales bacterium]
MSDPHREPYSSLELFSVARAFMRSRILLTAMELSIFTLIEEGKQTSAEIAAALSADERGVDRLLNALCAMDLLAKKENRFTNLESASRLLVEGKPEYLGGLLHAAHLYQTWATLTDAVRQGGSVLAAGSRSWDESAKTAFIAAMHGRGWTVAQQLAMALDLSNVERVLDVGGGSGLFSMAMARANPRLLATIFDLPDIVPLTRRYVEQEGLSDRITTVAGNYLTDELPADFDLVLLSAILHSNSPAENESLIRKCAAALAPTGRVVIQDHLMAENRTEPPEGAFFALNMLVNTTGGDTYTEEEIAGWLKQAGLTAIERLAAPGSPGILVGWKR